ncbi:hypothetical protein XENORESO_001416 [Xenotaenia resolanae]|uniref:Secreted protein n=1 Tax=Xenotaenia resolanae TaxID=208358 RepID=A0ABV0X7M8_9TELE
MFCKNFLWSDCFIASLFSPFMLFPLPATVSLQSASFGPPALCQSVYKLLCSVHSLLDHYTVISPALPSQLSQFHVQAFFCICSTFLSTSCLPVSFCLFIKPFSFTDQLLSVCIWVLLLKHSDTNKIPRAFGRQTASNIFHHT